MQVEIDLGNGFVDLGTQQMLSVPYALYSGVASNGILGVSMTGDTLHLSNGTFVIVPGISAANNAAQILGCTNNSACNYSSSATQDDGTCYFIGNPCDDNNDSTLSDTYNSDCVCEGSSGVTGSSLHTCGVSNVHNPNLTYGTMNDQEGNTYKTILIGTQEWMAENLNTSIYRNGQEIATNLSYVDWQSTTNTELGAWVYYNNDPVNECPYGKLYNWYAVNDSRGLCPTGWHIPSDVEWNVLQEYLGIVVAGALMKSEGTLGAGTGYWNAPNLGATNSSGFSALPGGYRYDTGEFAEKGVRGHWWSSTPNGIYYAWYRFLDYNNSLVYRYANLYTTDGLSVRCLRD